MDSLSKFPQILSKMSNKTRDDLSTDVRHVLKFVKTSQLTYDEVEKNLHDYLENMSENYTVIKDRIEKLNQESRLCELILEVIHYAEDQMDQHVVMFDNILKIVNRVRKMENDDTKFKEETIDKCSLLIYDTFSVLRSLRKHILELAKTYNVPYFYDTEEKTIRVRSSLLTTFKNLNTVMHDFSVLSEALWYVRHYNYFGPGGDDVQKPADDQQGQKARLTLDWQNAPELAAQWFIAHSGLIFHQLVICHKWQLTKV